MAAKAFQRLWCYVARIKTWFCNRRPCFARITDLVSLLCHQICRDIFVFWTRWTIKPQASLDVFRKFEVRCGKFWSRGWCQDGFYFPCKFCGIVVEQCTSAPSGDNNSERFYLWRDWRDEGKLMKHLEQGMDLLVLLMIRGVHKHRTSWLRREISLKVCEWKNKTFCLLTYSMAQQTSKSFGRLLVRVSLSNLVALIFY